MINTSFYPFKIPNHQLIALKIKRTVIDKVLVLESIRLY